MKAPEGRTGETARRPAVLEVARSYLARGWSVIPVCPPDHARCSQWHEDHCQSPGKAPLVSWAPFQTELPTEAQLEEWFSFWPNANIGVACGPVSRLVAIDVDGPSGQTLLEKFWGGNDNVPTIGFTTGRPGSFRLLYSIPEGHPAPLWPMETPDGETALTIIGHGGQTVMPPSRHASGGLYQWAENGAELAEAPAWLLERLAAREAEAASGASRSRVFEGDGEVIPRGGRNTRLLSMGGAVRRLGATEGEIRAFLTEVNNRCDPPLHQAEVNRISRSLTRYEPAEVPTFRQLVAQATRPAAACLVEMRDVEPKAVSWVWPGWIPAGMLVCVDGDGGVGKSSVMIDVMARITRGDAMPDGSRPTAWPQGEPQNVLLICCEDALAETIRPRIDAAGGDVTRFKFLEEVCDPKTAEVRSVEFPRDLDTIAAVVADNDIRLVCIDPVLAFLGAENDYSRDQDVRRAVGRLKRIAEEKGCAFVYVRHWNKGSQGSKASYRGGGSLAWSNLARCQVIVGHSPDREGCGEWHNPKNNLAPRQQGLVYRATPVASGVTRIEWLGRSDRSPDEVSNGKIDEDRVVVAAIPDSCAEWLRKFLADGPVAADEVRREAQSMGYGQGQLLEAQRETGAESYQRGGVWWWKIETKLTNGGE